jgi:DNA end-binding protein Ku
MPGNGSAAAAIPVFLPSHQRHMARPLWQGQIQISLVSLGVNLFPASNSSRQVEFHQVDRATGERIHHQNVSAEGEEPVEKTDIAKGYEYEKGKLIVIDPEELKKLRLPGQKTLEIVQFVETDEIDPAFFEKPYFVVPKDDTQARAMAIISRALRDTRSMGLGEITFSGREHLVALSAPQDEKGKGLRLYVMRYNEELRDPAEYYKGIASPPVDEKQLSLAKELIEHYRAPFDPDKFKDDYETAVKALVKAKLEHKPLPKGPPEPKRGKVIDIMDALKQSLASKKASASAGSATAAKEASAKPRKSKSASSRKGKAA